MRTKLILLIVFLSAGKLVAQTSEGRSGVQMVNISKSKPAEQPVSRNIKDSTPPKINVLSPDIRIDSAKKSTSPRLLVKGRVEDEAGIFEVIVNGVDARVASDGSFVAEIPLTVGENPVTVRATDISLNRSSITFIYQRVPEAVAAAPVKPVNKYSIDIVAPSTDNFTTASDKFNLKACITATAPIKKVMITRNGNFVNGYFSNNIVKKENCDFLVDEPLALRLGMNDLKIEVFAEDDT
ncbi:MAG: hypothetical protein ACM3UT_00040, partial [Chloroflexota bacterium]